MVGGPLTVSGAVSLSGRISMSGHVSLSGPVSADGTVSGGGPANLSSSLAVSGDVTVSGRSDLGGFVHAGTELTVDGPLTAGQGVLDVLAVHSDAVVGAGANGALIVRHVNGKRVGNDRPDGLFLNWDVGQTVHVGGSQPADLDVIGTAFVAGRLGVKTSSLTFDVHVNGTVCAVTFCNPSDVRVKSEVVELVDVAERLARPGCWPRTCWTSSPNSCCRWGRTECWRLTTPGWRASSSAR